MNNIEVTPFGNRILVKLSTVGEELQSESGIYIPSETTDVKLGKGTILALGHLCEYPLNKGDVVSFELHSKVQIEGLSDEYVVVHESDILVKFN